MRIPGRFITAVVALASALCICGTSFAVESKLLDVRNRLFEEAKAIQFGMAASTDTAVMFSLWDSSMITITQMNAYFYMLGIFEDNGKRGGDVSFNYLSSWLQEMKRSAQMNARNYSQMPGDAIKEEGTRKHLARVRQYYAELNTLLDGELAKVAVLRKAAAKKK